jgi:hypothetical protein
MKKNRSNKFTTGLCNTFKNIDAKTFFFEIDSNENYSKICQVFLDNKLDFFVHKTGSGGFHFISPTLITRQRWKEIMIPIKKINPKCPMTTLRMNPNKYYGEESFWYFKYIEQTFDNEEFNSKQMCDYLNRIFKTNFVGKVDSELKIVNYPLPIMELS